MKRTLCKEKFVGQMSSVLIPHVLVNFQQIAGYSAGIDYPNYSEVPQGGSFSCQNRIPGKNIFWNSSKVLQFLCWKGLETIRRSQLLRKNLFHFRILRWYGDEMPSLALVHTVGTTVLLLVPKRNSLQSSKNKYFKLYKLRTLTQFFETGRPSMRLVF